MNLARVDRTLEESKSPTRSSTNSASIIVKLNMNGPKVNTVGEITRLLNGKSHRGLQRHQKLSRRAVDAYTKTNKNKKRTLFSPFRTLKY